MIYLDSCILIYALEGEGSRRELVLARLGQAGDHIVAISPLVAHECLVGPVRDGNHELRDAYEQMFARLTMLDLGMDVFVRAAELRARSSLRAPDALHLAAAQLAGCTQLWTNDGRFARAAHGLAVDVVS